MKGTSEVQARTDGIERRHQSTDGSFSERSEDSEKLVQLATDSTACVPQIAGFQAGPSSTLVVVE